MVSATKCAFCWGIPAFRAVHTIVLATTFDARIWSVAISACMSVLLATCTLRDVVFISFWWFCVNDFILYGRYFVNFFLFVAGSRSIKELSASLIILWRTFTIFLATCPCCSRSCLMSSISE